MVIRREEEEKEGEGEGKEDKKIWEEEEKKPDNF